NFQVICCWRRRAAATHDPVLTPGPERLRREQGTWPPCGGLVRPGSRRDGDGRREPGATGVTPGGHAAARSAAARAVRRAVRRGHVRRGIVAMATSPAAR